MVASFLQNYWGSPVNTFAMIFMLGLWFYLWNGRFTGDLLSINYTKVMVDGQWWRIITSAFTHLSFIHIAFNMYSLYGLWFVEEALNSLEYVKVTFILLSGSEIFYLFLAWAYRRFFHRDTLVQQSAVGYSGVLFGWMAYIALTGIGEYPFFFNVPQWLIPWIYLVLIQIIVPRVSFVGHLAGVLIGHLAAWGIFDWFDFYLLAVSIFWSIIIVIYSLKVTNTLEMSWIQYMEASDRELTVVNGEIIYMDQDRDGSASGDDII